MALHEALSGMQLHAYLGLPMTNGGPSYTCEQLLSRMNSEDLQISLYTPADRRREIKTGLSVHSTLPPIFRRLPYRPMASRLLRLTEKRFIRRVETSESPPAVYLWGNVSIDLSSSVKRSASYVIREKYNCDISYAEGVLRDAYRALGAEDAFPSSTYHDAIKKAELESLHAADLIFCPSPMVAHSLTGYGLDDRLAATSYGIDPDRLKGDGKALPPSDGPTFLFVGSICVRKGAHILLEAWKKANVAGRLVLVGNIEPFIIDRYQDILNLPSVERHSFTSNVGDFYRSADWFVFPSLEEGSPLVTYEAAYCGVPAIVSKMGAGEIIRDRMEGIIIDSHAVDVWAEALVSAAEGAYKHDVMGHKAHLRACQFTWDKVAAQRADIICARLGTRTRTL